MRLLCRPIHPHPQRKSCSGFSAPHPTPHHKGKILQLVRRSVPPLLTSSLSALLTSHSPRCGSSPTSANAWPKGQCFVSSNTTGTRVALLEPDESGKRKYVPVTRFMHGSGMLSQCGCGREETSGFGVPASGRCSHCSGTHLCWVPLVWWCLLHSIP